MKKKIHEMGRTLTEMLSVLVIVGVLSMSAFMGYSYAINKQEANTIFNDVRMLTTLVMSSDFLEDSKQETITPEELGVDMDSHNYYLISKGESTTFYITVMRVRYGVCKQLVVEKIPYVEEIVANPTSSKICEDTKTNEVDFYISEEFMQDSDKPDLDLCDDKTPCAGMCHQCVRGKCVDRDDKCPSGQTCSSGSCTCPNGKLVGSDGTCYGCDISNTVKVTSPSECGKCPGKVAIFSGANESRCYECGQMFWLITSEAECSKCWHVFFGSNPKMGACGYCWVSMNPESTKAQCEKCSNRYFIGDTDASGTCAVCDGMVSADGRSCIPN